MTDSNWGGDKRSKQQKAARQAVNGKGGKGSWSRSTPADLRNAHSRNEAYSNGLIGLEEWQELVRLNKGYETDG